MPGRYESRRFARRFDRLRRCQEEACPTLSVIESIRDIRGDRVVELGAGTGVVTRALVSRARWVVAFDRSPFMIGLAQENMRRLGVSSCCFARADHRRIPLADRCADLVVAAWTLDGVVLDSAAGCWRAELDLVVAEIRRLLVQGGTAIVLASPYCGPRDYLRRLEEVHGFRRRLFKSAWRFPTKRVAREAVRFFLHEQAWASYRTHWPKDLVTLGGVWWL